MAREIRTLNPAIGDVGGTDLGIPAFIPSGEVGVVFGDTFGGRAPKFPGPNWRSPVMLRHNTKDPAAPIEWVSAARGGAQLIDYRHPDAQGRPQLPEGVTTVLPCDHISINGTIYMWVMFTAGLGNERWSEIITSTDNGETWKRGKTQFRASDFGGRRVMVSWDIKPGSDYVDVFSTGGLARNKGIIRFRVKKDRLEDPAAWEVWGFDGSWGWGKPVAEVLTGKFGEIGFRYIQGNALLSGFDAGQYDIFVKVGADSGANWFDAPRTRIVHGNQLNQLYGGYVDPTSKFGKLRIIVSQWRTATDNTYRSIQYLDSDVKPVALIDDSKRTDIAATTPTPRPPAHGGKPVPKPAFDLRVQISPNRHARGGNTSHLKALHTQEGNGTAASLANYLCNPNSKVSYHITVDNNRNVVRVVNSSDASWSVGNANADCTNICFANSRAAWTEKQWHDNMGNGMEIAAYLMVVECLNDKHDARVIGWDEIRAGRAGITDHFGVNEAFLNAKGHWDVGPNFPWGWFAGRVKYYAENGIESGPTVNLIDEAAKANPWLGARRTEGEGVGKDDGRWAHFENGSVYFKRGSTAAYALGRKDTWLKFEQTNYEHGKLGYPNGPRIEVVAYIRSSDGVRVPGGVIQSFEGGAVYFQEDPAEGDGFIVEGGIRNLYRDLGYEGGKLGWPTSDEIAVGKYVYQTFERGTVVWHLPSGDSLVLGPTGEQVVLPKAEAPTRDLVGKTLIDYSAGVPAAKDVKAAGHVGAVRYVSDPRESWMKGKPLRKAEVDDFHAQGLVVVSNYQYSKGGNETSDWTIPADGPGDAARGLEIHKAAGGPDSAPIYVSVDASPTREMYERLVRPYLKHWQAKVGNERLGVYANGRVISWLIADGIGSFYWQHNWSDNWIAADGKVNGDHPAAHIHQVRIDKDYVAGLKVDINIILKPNFGQW